MKKIRLNRIGRKGQLGPISLENIFPMVLAIIILFVFTTIIFKSIATSLEERNIESMHETGLNLMRVMHSKSVFVYGSQPGLLEKEKLDEYLTRYDELVNLYGTTGYSFEMEVSDLDEEGNNWVFTAGPREGNSVTVATPVAIRYDVDKVHSGLLKIMVWRGANDA